MIKSYLLLGYDKYKDKDEHEENSENIYNEIVKDFDKKYNFELNTNTKLQFISNYGNIFYYLIILCIIYLIYISFTMEI